MIRAYQDDDVQQRMQHLGNAIDIIKEELITYGLDSDTKSNYTESNQSIPSQARESTTTTSGWVVVSYVMIFG